MVVIILFLMMAYVVLGMFFCFNCCFSVFLYLLRKDWNGLFVIVVCFLIECIIIFLFLVIIMFIDMNRLIIFNSILKMVICFDNIFFFFFF